MFFSVLGFQKLPPGKGLLLGQLDRPKQQTALKALKHAKPVFELQNVPVKRFGRQKLNCFPGFFREGELGRKEAHS